MKIVETYSYRHAEAILQTVYPTEKGEIEDALRASPWTMYKTPKLRKRTGKYLTIDQVATNKVIDKEFVARGWQNQPMIVSASTSRLRADFRKSKVQVEVQLGNMARWYTDVFKFLLSYSSDDIEVGVLAVPTKTVADQIDENVAYYERVLRELPHAKMGITLPIWVMALGKSN